MFVAVDFDPDFGLVFLDVADIPFHLAVLMPMTGASKVGPRIAGAVALAVEQVNADSSLLPRRVLEYSWADSGCSQKQALAAMSRLLRGEAKISAVIGPGCSAACEVTSYLSAGQSIPQISWGCTGPSLSKKTEYELVRLIEGTSICPLRRGIYASIYVVESTCISLCPCSSLEPLAQPRAQARHWLL